jgi:DNA-directed RNA polymerase subunit RPC12/RpoP
VGGQWEWKFADDHRQTVLFSDGQLLYRMPCMEKIVAASNARAQAAPATPVETTPAGSNSSQSQASFWWLVGGLILVIIAYNAIKEMNRKELAALPDVPVKCPYCGSTQVHAGARGFKLTTGFIGSGKVRLTCLRCGRQFRPGHGGYGCLRRQNPMAHAQVRRRRSSAFWPCGL